MSEAQPTEKLTDLQEQLQAKDQQLKELTERLQRLQADFDNYRKRLAREQEELFRRMEDQIILEILPLYDNMERAFRSFNKNQDRESFVEGMERIFAQFHAFLEGRGVRPISAIGELYDPALHEALITVEVTDDSGGKVLEEFERGYLRAGRLLKPSKVKVGKRKEPTSPPAEQAAHS
ncbi:MAG: nucleotide exchange factor GrpE [Candidatus Bipolaricaulota bacterium]|nr:nucleotide exchange factor GrpE [Candidatus Bipolaricaulota bacterium]MCS7273854.1 nucleotide exchange factor GrpE [Candidatus Bipolaricaulota bacterium]MDW8110728.1 nucleotide exchange factor GrpE [Candidatus Bipolaricaulota bacterium]MDW8328414.1 nucleotide exchange factor GrpE [Candidatus Bipolaricaulota bacterium]